MKMLMQYLLLLIALMDVLSRNVTILTIGLIFAAGLFAIADSIFDVAFELKQSRLASEQKRKEKETSRANERAIS